MKKLLHIQTSLQHNTYKIGSVLAPVFRARVTLLCMLMVLSVAQSYAFSRTFYATLTAKVTSSGGGKVIVTDSNTEPTDKSSYSNSSSKDGKNKRGNTINTYDSADITLYAYAQADQGYSFDGWYDSETGGNKIGSTIQYTWKVNSTAFKDLFEKWHNESSKPDETIYARFVPNSEQTINFRAPTNGSYTASNGTTTITDNGSLRGKTFNLNATSKTNYKFFGWYTTTDGGNTKKYFSYDATCVYVPSPSTVSIYVGADFVSNDTPIFIVKSAPTIKYKDLNAADNAAGGSGTIVLIDNGILPAGAYTISSGNTLLIPYDDAYTVSTTKAAVVTEKDGWQKLSVYKTLNLANGANITVQSGAAISVGGKQFSTSNQMGSAGGPGTPTGPYGCINMSKGGNITLQSGSFLYAWGFITGQNMDQGNNTTGVGTIIAENGATVYEDIVIADWHGGNATSGMDSKKKYFPFNQYFIPNIEVSLTINYGATLNTVSDISAGWGSNKDPYNVPITFIAKTGGLFNLQSSSSSAKLWYDATTDEQHFEFTGDNTIEGISANVGGYVTVNASNYVMPVTSNFNIHIKSGTLTVPDDIALLPGSKVTLDDGVTATISKGTNVYIYDLANWGPYSYGSNRKVYPFRPTRFKKYDQGDNQAKPEDVASKTGLADAKLVVNGTLDIQGNVYTTEAGADICSTGYGQVKFSAAPTASATTYQVSGLSTDVSINVTAPQFHNADGSYVQTAGAAANTTYYYDPNAGTWATTEPAGPSFSHSGTKVTLDKAYLLTNGITAKFAENFKSFATGKTVLSADFSNATGSFDVADMRSTIGATDDNNVLLYAPATAQVGDIHNVIVNGTCANFVITDKQPIDVPTAFTATNASYSRATSSYKWGTICLPFELTSGNGIKYYQLEKIDGNQMTFTETQTVKANTPAIYSIEGSDVEINSNNVTIAKGGSMELPSGGFTLVGVQSASKTLPVSDKSPYYYIAQDKFWQPTKNPVTVAPQRAYFKTNGSASLAKVFSIGIVEDGGTTGIDSTPWNGNEPTVVGIYTVGGMRLNSLQPGINILRMSDGTTKKVIIKNK